MDTKPQIRAAVRAARNAADAPANLASEFAATLASLVSAQGAKRVSCFVSVRGEPDTSGFFAWALHEGIEVLLPRVISDTQMEWALLTHDPLIPGAFGVPEPTGPAVDPTDVAAPLDLMLVPAAAVDRTGTRLGWGRGYFDRELAAIHKAHTAHPPSVFAVVFEREIFDCLPADAHDVPVNGAVSEVATHRFR